MPLSWRLEWSQNPFFWCELEHWFRLNSPRKLMYVVSYFMPRWSIVLRNEQFLIGTAISSIWISWTAIIPCWSNYPVFLSWVELIFFERPSKLYRYIVLSNKLTHWPSIPPCPSGFFYFPAAITLIVFPQSNDIQLIFSVPVNITRSGSTGEITILFTIPT